MMSEFKLCKWAFHGNRLIQAEMADVSVTNHALNFGTGVFETLRLYKSSNDTLILGLKKHMDRFENSINSIGLPELAIKDVEDALDEFIDKNNISEGYVRIVAYPYGPCNSLDISEHSTTFSIFGWHISGTRFLPPVSLNVSYLRRPNSSSSLPRAKVCGLYAVDVVSQLNARCLGFDTGLLLNEDGTVCEAAGANLFIVKDSKIYTPIISNSINGITASLVSDIASFLGIELEKTPLTLEDIFSADEVFITGTFYGIRPVMAIDRVKFFQSTNSLTNTLIAKFEEVLERNENSIGEKWLTTCKKKPKNRADSCFKIIEASAEDENFVVHGVGELIKELRNINSAPEIKGIRDAYKRIINSTTLDKIFIALSQNGEKCGFISISEQCALHCGGNYITIQELWTKPNFRSLGVGKQLVKYVEEYCRNNGISRIDVGLPDYTFLGFPETYDFYSRNEFIDIGVRMKKGLQ
ncbi:MAG: GNAT family N-acetyltransferase [Bacillota bacterium]